MIHTIVLGHSISGSRNSSHVLYAVAEQFLTQPRLVSQCFTHPVGIPYTSFQLQVISVSAPDTSELYPVTDIEYLHGVPVQWYA